MLARWLGFSSETSSQSVPQELMPTESLSPPVSGARDKSRHEVSAESMPTLNVERLQEWEELAGEDSIGLLQRVVHQFLKDALESVAAVQKALEEKDWTSLQHAVHGLKGVSENVGASHLAHLSKRIERHIRDQLFEDMPSAVKRLVEEMDHAQQALHDYVGKITKDER